MYTQEIICPYCGKMTRVNVADTEGTTITPCQHRGLFSYCKGKIAVITDKEGKVISVKKKGFFG